MTGQRSRCPALVHVETSNHPVHTYRSNIAPVDGIKIHRVQLGAIGKSDAAELNGYIASYVPMIEDLVEAGKLIPNDYQIIGQVGLESVIQAWKEQQKNSGAGGKYLARIQSP